MEPESTYTASELRELADGLKRILAAVESGSMTGDSGVVARLEGAVAALEALAGSDQRAAPGARTRGHRQTDPRAG